jgi:hypothetical protein
MKALISPAEAFDAGQRIAQMSAQEFDVAPPLFWAEVPDGVTPESHYWDAVAQAAVQVAGLSQAQLISATLAKARAMRLDILKVLDGLQVSAVVTSATVLMGDPPAPAPLAPVIETLKQALRDLPQTVDLTPYTTQAQMEQAVLVAYYAIAQSAPAQVQSAFQSLVP